MKRVCIAVATPDFAAGIIREKFLGQFHSAAPLPAAADCFAGWHINHAEHLPPPAFRKAAASSRNAKPLGALDFEIRIYEHPEPKIEADIWIIQGQTQAHLNTERFGDCHLVIHAGAGAGGVELEQARAEGILVASVPDAASRETAIHLNRTMTPHWEARAVKTRSSDIPVRVGLVGMGSLGQWMSKLRADAELVSPIMNASGFCLFGWEFWGHDPFKPDHVFETCNVRRAPLHEIAGLCDLVSIQVPLCADTRGLIGADYFQFQKPGQVIFNASPPEVVDTSVKPDARVTQLNEKLGELCQTETARALALERALEIAALFVAGEVPDHLLMDPPIPRMVKLHAPKV